MRKIFIVIVLFSIPFAAMAVGGNFNAFLGYHSITMQEEPDLQKSHSLVMNSNLFLGFPTGPFTFGVSCNYTLGAILQADLILGGSLRSLGFSEMSLPLIQGLGAGLGAKYELGPFQLLCCIGPDLEVMAVSMKEYKGFNYDQMNHLTLGPSVSITQMIYFNENVGIGASFKFVYDVISPFYPNWVLPRDARVYSIMCGAGVSVKF